VNLAGVDVDVATIHDKPVVGRLLELYCYDFSAFTDADVDDHGSFGYRYFDEYWTEHDRHPFLIRVDGHIAGFAFVRSGFPHDMAEFFVIRKHRRGGVGVQVARSVLSRFPGEWQVRQVAANTAAVAFWHAAIPVPFSEDTDEGGTVQRFRIPGPDDV
jgi:predicted acetyltransferase